MVAEITLLLLVHGLVILQRVQESDKICNFCQKPLALETVFVLHINHSLDFFVLTLSQKPKSSSGCKLKPQECSPVMRSYLPFTEGFVCLVGSDTTAKV